MTEEISLIIPKNWKEILKIMLNIENMNMIKNIL